jgi:hypothetical protein
MSIFHSSSVANLCYKLIPSITTFCVTLGAVGIYNNNIINNSIMTNEVGSNTSQIPGPQGPAGTQGETGPQGPAGAKGETGPQGPIGDEGATSAGGAKGATGPAGPQGATGPAGPQGATGAAGSSSSGGGSGLLIRDGAGALIEGFHFKDINYASIWYVFQNGAMFKLNPDTGIYKALSEAQGGIYATSDCTGLKVAPGDLAPNDSYSEVVYNTVGEVIDTIATYKVGNVKTAGSTYNNHPTRGCEEWDRQGYYQAIPITKPSPVPTPVYFSPN